MHRQRADAVKQAAGGPLHFHKNLLILPAGVTKTPAYYHFITKTNCMKSVFNPAGASEIIDRIGQLTPASQPQWGKMNVGQMLAHCNVTYEMVFEPEKHPKPGAFMRWILKTFIKGKVVSEKPYKPGSPTAPQFKIAGERDFANEKTRLVDYINKVRQMGTDHFEGWESHSFGRLSAAEWNNMFYKHLDHHLRQFGV